MTTPTNVPNVRAVLPPPDNFDAVHATDAELAYYALPPRPNSSADPGGYAMWLRAMTSHMKRVQPDIALSSRKHGPAQSATLQASGVYQSVNWSGYEYTVGIPTYSPTASVYVVSGEFTMPTCSNEWATGTDYTAIWFGIDGWVNPKAILQAGVQCQATFNTNQQNTPNGVIYFPWIEWYPNNEAQVSGFSVAPNDVFLMWVWDTSATTGFAYFDDLTTGQGFEFALSAPSASPIVGNTAEWIVERPLNNHGLTILAEYTGFQMIYSYAQLYNNGAVGSGPIINTSSANSYAIWMYEQIGGNVGWVSEASALGPETIEFQYVTP